MSWLDRGPRKGSILMAMIYVAAFVMLVVMPLWMWFRGTL